MAGAVRAVMFEGSPYLPLRLVEEQLDTVEGLWSRRPALVFHKRLDSTHLVRHDERISALLDGLELRRDEAIREAMLRMASPVPSECFAGTLALLHLEPARAVGEDGKLSLRPRRPEVVVPAFRCAPVEAAARLGPTEPLGLEARVLAGVLPPTALVPHLQPSAPGVLLALRAAACLPADDAVLSACLRLAFDDPSPGAPPGVHARALFALGTLFARTAERDAFPALVDSVLGDRLFERPFAVRAMTIFGSSVTARRVAARIQTSGPNAELIFCLGLLGVPEQAGVLASLVAESEMRVALEATRALHTMGGVWAVEGGPTALRDDGKDVAPEPAVAQQLASALAANVARRLHLGEDLAAAPSPQAPASLAWLHALTQGSHVHAAREVPEGILESRTRPVALWEVGPPPDEGQPT